MLNINEIISNFKISGDYVNHEPFGEGHINDTYAVNFTNGTHKRYILQRINTNVFKNPEQLMSNVVLVTDFLRKKAIANNQNIEREVLTLVESKQNNKFYAVDESGNFWRVYNFIECAKSYQVAEDKLHLYESGKAFGAFQKNLNDFDASTLFETIPNFHNTKSRIQDFKLALKENKAGRVDEIVEEIDFIFKRENEADVLQQFNKEGLLPLRVTHNDTKFNNVLLDEATGKAVCVIDLDTVMPGLSAYDFGDSIRSGTNTAEEDEADLSKVDINLTYFEYFTKGFLEEMKEFLTPTEIDVLPFSAKLITFEIGVRFLTDYLNGDIYFKIQRESHNLDRARNQFKLVSEIENKFEEMTAIVEKYCK